MFANIQTPSARTAAFPNWCAAGAVRQPKAGLAPDEGCLFRSFGLSLQNNSQNQNFEREDHFHKGALQSCKLTPGAPGSRRIFADARSNKTLDYAARIGNPANNLL